MKDGKTVAQQLAEVIEQYEGSKFSGTLGLELQFSCGGVRGVKVKTEATLK